MKPIDCAARNEGRTCLSCEAWEAGVRAGESIGVGRFFPDHADIVAYCERGPERVAIDLDAADGLLMINQTQAHMQPSPLTIEPLRFNGHGAFDLDGEDDGES